MYLNTGEINFFACKILRVEFKKVLSLNESFAFDLVNLHTTPSVLPNF